MGQRKPKKADMQKQMADDVAAHCLLGRDQRNYELMLQAIIGHRPDMPIAEAGAMAVALAKVFRWRVLEAAE